MGPTPHKSPALCFQRMIAGQHESKSDCGVRPIRRGSGPKVILCTFGDEIPATAAYAQHCFYTRHIHPSTFPRRFQPAAPFSATARSTFPFGFSGQPINFIGSFIQLGQKNLDILSAFAEDISHMKNTLGYMNKLELGCQLQE
jgi:hypothetical protein